MKYQLHEIYQSASGFMPSVSLSLGLTLAAGLASPNLPSVDSSCYRFPFNDVGHSFFYHQASLEVVESGGDLLQSFADQMLSNTVELPVSATQIINEHFWDLLL